MFPDSSCTLSISEVIFCNRGHPKSDFVAVSSRDILLENETVDYAGIVYYEQDISQERIGRSRVKNSELFDTCMY